MSKPILKHSSKIGESASDFIWSSYLEDLSRATRQIYRIISPYESQYRKKTAWTSSWDPEADVLDNGSFYIIYMDAPGLSKEDLDIGFENKDTLYVRGVRQEEHLESRYIRIERASGEFERLFYLPLVDGKREPIVTFGDGVLTIRVYKTKESRSKTAHPYHHPVKRGPKPSGTLLQNLRQQIESRKHTRRELLKQIEGATVHIKSRLKEDRKKEWEEALEAKVERYSPLSSSLHIELEEEGIGFVGKAYAVRAEVLPTITDRLDSAVLDALGKSVTIDVLLHTNDCLELASGRHQRLCIDLHVSEPERASFEVEVTAPGTGLVAADFYHERRWLNTVELNLDTHKVP